MSQSPAAILNQAISCRPHVVSLHAPDGQVQVVFSSPSPMQTARVVNGWSEYLATGYIAIEWWNGSPSQSFNRV